MIDTLLLTERKKDKKKGIDFNIKNSDYNLSDNLSFKIGTVSDKNFPATVYLLISFWFKLNKEKILEDFDADIYFNRYFRKELNKIYQCEITKLIKNSSLFPFFENNIFSYDIPTNVVYSDKRCFCSVELTLHTSNINNKEARFENNYSNELFKNCLDIGKIISESDFLNKNQYLSIYTRKK